MVLRIALTPEIEARLRARAAAVGKNLESYVLEAVEEKLCAPERFTELLAPLHEATAATGVTEAGIDAFLEECRDERYRGPEVADSE